MTVGELVDRLQDQPVDAEVFAVDVFMTTDGVWHERVADASAPDHIRPVVDVEFDGETVVIGIAEGFANYAAADHPGGTISG